MMGERGGVTMASVPAMLLALITLASPAEACGAAALGEGRVVAIDGTRTLRLGDGRTIRLAGIEWVASPETARAALTGMALGRTVILKGTATPDRYGRIHAFPSVNGSATPIQYALLDRGLAVTGIRIGDTACRDALLSRERAARIARQGPGLGIGSAGDYRLHQADDPAAILTSLGRFAIVEGRVLSVRESGSTVYVNFGRRWSEDFTVTIAKRTEADFIAAGLPPLSLTGRMVRVRGVIEDRAGPWIEATAADQFDWDGRP